MVIFTGARVSLFKFSPVHNTRLGVEVEYYFNRQQFGGVFSAMNVSA
jgi:hypothetical protein